MSLLQPSDGKYNILLAILRLMNAKKGNIEESQLVSLLAPKSICKNQDAVKNTLRRWIDFGFLTKDDQGNVGYSREIVSGKFYEDDMPHYTRKVIFSPEHNQPFISDGIDGTTDFTRTLSWMLSLDIYRASFFAWNDVQNQLESHIPPSRVVLITNNTRWTPFREWFVYLGFGWISKAGTSPEALIIDPTKAVRDTLSVVFEGQKELRAADFIQSLASSLPILDGGKYRTEIEDIMRESNTDWKSQSDGQISSSLSRALQRLEYEQVIDLPSRADAGSGIQLTGRDGAVIKDVSHVVLKS